MSLDQKPRVLLTGGGGQVGQAFQRLAVDWFEVVAPSRTELNQERPDLWWSVALFLGPIVGASTGGPAGALAATALFALPAFVLFDTDRSWWPSEVRRLSQDPVRSRKELRKLTLSSGVALLAGITIAAIRPPG